MPTFVLMGREGEALLDSALALPKQSAGGKPAYPSVFDKAAVLFRSLNKNHPWIDGNKRMAVIATFVFLFINRHALLVSPSDLVTMALKVANSPGPSLSDIAQWLREHSLRLVGAKREDLLKAIGDKGLSVGVLRALEVIDTQGQQDA